MRRKQQELRIHSQRTVIHQLQLTWTTLASRTAVIQAIQPAKLFDFRDSHVEKKTKKRKSLRQRSLRSKSLEDYEDYEDYADYNESVR